LRKQVCYLLQTRNRLYWTVNREVVPGQTITTCRGGSTSPCILNLSTTWRWVVSFRV